MALFNVRDILDRFIQNPSERRPINPQTPINNSLLTGDLRTRLNNLQASSVYKKPEPISQPASKKPTLAERFIQSGKIPQKILSPAQSIFQGSMRAIGALTNRFVETNPEIVKAWGIDPNNRVTDPNATGLRKIIQEELYGKQGVGTVESEGAELLQAFGVKNPKPQHAIGVGIASGLLEFTGGGKKKTVEKAAPSVINFIKDGKKLATMKERGFIKSVKQSPNIVSEIKKTVEGKYLPISNLETMVRAKQLVDTDPVKAMANLAQDTLDADFTATALSLMNRAQKMKNYEEAAEVAGIAAEKLTKGGQFIQAASMLNKLSPEGILVYASRKLGAKNLTPKIAEQLTDQARKLQTLDEGYEKFLETQKLADIISDNMKLTKAERAKEALFELANMPRTLMSSFDLSAGLRQGIMALPRYPKEFGSAFKAQFKAFASEKGYGEIMDQVIKNKNFHLAEEAGLGITDINMGLLAREEKFMSTWAEKIPVLGRAVRASNRAYTGLLNKLRMDTFSRLVDDAEKIGVDLTNNLDKAKEYAAYINDMTGRGKFPGVTIEKANPLLNGLLYSPRLMASRLNMLIPYKYVNTEPHLRKEYLKTMLAFGGTMSTILGLASLHPDVKVGTDPRSADFAKIKVGDTRYDIMGGFQQYLRFAGQMISGKYVSTTTGKVITMGEGYKPLTRAQIALRFLESKEAPVFSFLTTMLKQQDFEGNPVSAPKEIGKRFIPMLLSDLWELYQNDPALLPTGWLGALGVGVQSYPMTEAIMKMREIDQSEDSEAAFEQLLKDDPKMASKVKDAKIKENFTEFDWGLTYMGVENNRRAEFLYEHFKNLPNDEAREELWEDLRAKRLISDRVAEQLTTLIQNNPY